MPCGRPATIEAKIISEMPLPIPRWVISSPIHMTSMQPAVSETAIRISFEQAEVRRRPAAPACCWNERKRKTYAIDCAPARPTVR